MITIIQFYRLLIIFSIMLTHAVRHGLRPKKNTRGKMIRETLEKLGPIYVKFGQALSTRGDLISEEIVTELEKLQDRVPAFPAEKAIAIVERAFQKNITELYQSFDLHPIAAASIAQVHGAILHSGENAVVKIIRPNIRKVIRHDIAVLKLCAKILEKFWKHGKRLRMLSVVNEFEKIIYDELDLSREAANASQLRRNFERSPIMYVPKVYWEFTANNVMTMERIVGTPIAQMNEFKKRNVNLKKLAAHGVEIFFTQVFRDAFFHADMHPGNLFVDITDPENPRYMGVDFGIMGTLSPMDQRYLAENMLAFLSRDYRRVAELHVLSGWVPKETRVDEFESAIRTVCEPIFAKPLSQISFGGLLLKLFQTAERFDMHVQPQLILLQKTLLYIESLGRKIYPELDLWETGKPLLKQWMRKQRSPRTLLKLFLKNGYDNTEKLIQLPKLLYEALEAVKQRQ